MQLQEIEHLKLVAQGSRSAIYEGIQVVKEENTSAKERQVSVKLLEIDAVDEAWFDLQRRLARVHHPSLLPILGVGLNETQQPFVITRRYDAKPLVDWLEHFNVPPTPLPPETAVALIVQLGQALEQCHRAGIVHQGLKPGNVLILEGDDSTQIAALLTDFGLPPDDSASVFIAPELLEFKSASAKSDIYGLGGLLLALLTRKNPIGGSISAELSRTSRLQMAEQWGGLIETQLKHLPLFLRDTVGRALRPHPQDRHATLAEFIHELRASFYTTAGIVARGTRPAPAGWAKVQGALGGVDIRDGLMEPVSTSQRATRDLVQFQLRHRDDTGAWNKSGVFFYNTGDLDAEQTFNAVSSAWSGAELSLYNAIEVPKNGARYYTGDTSTLPILQPYFPIAVTTVVNSEGCGSRFLTDLRDGGSSGTYLVLGRVVHAMLEEMVAPSAVAEDVDPSKEHISESFDVLFWRIMQQFRLDALAAGLDDSTMGKLKDTIQRHYQHLQDIATRSRQNMFAGVTTEVTRYSGEYGLEGRLDLVFDDGEAFNILELKTGRPRERDNKQVRCYALLWDHLGETLGRRVTGEVVYSRSGSSRKVHRDQHDRDRQIIKSRNEIVSLHRHLAWGDTRYAPPFYMQFPSECRNQACKFRQKKCEQQSRVIGLGPFGDPKYIDAPRSPWRGVDPELVQLARAYYRRFVSYVESEHWTTTTRLGHILRTDTLGDRIKALTASAGLTIADIQPELSRITFKGDKTQILSQGTKVIAHRGDFRTSPILTGRVLVSSPGVVVVESAATSTAINLPKTDWVLDCPPARIGYRTSHRALFDLMRCRDVERLNLILRRQPSESRTVEPDPDDIETPRLPAIEHLNPRQQEAIAGALAGHHAYLIQGPPGTGKTTVIAEILARLMDQGRRVLLAAGTNTAVDNVLKRLAQNGYTRFLRLGDQRSSKDLVKALEKAGHDPDNFFSRNLANRMESLDALNQRIFETPVIASTTHRACTSPIIEALERRLGHIRDHAHDLPTLFDVAILDEASQITEPMALGAIHRAARFVLVGDHKQLPPIVSSDNARSEYVETCALQPNLDERSEHDLNAEKQLLDIGGVRGLDQSLFERLMGHVPSTRLNIQYRMNHQIMAFSSRSFYEHDLMAAEQVHDLKLPVDASTLRRQRRRIEAALDPERPIVLFDVQGQEHKRQNFDEAERVIELLTALLSTGLLKERLSTPSFEPGLAAAQIGIISPFRAQVLLIRQLIEERLQGFAAHIDVDTVDRFQGGEKEIVIVSCVASGRTSSFLADERRLNVTLTRARSKLIVIGHLLTLTEISPLFRDMINMPEAFLVR